MPRISLVETAHALIGQHLSPGDAAVDATVGNGHDTLFLAQCVGGQGRVFGFDVQPGAIESTRQRLRQHGMEQPVTLIQASHAEMRQAIPAEYHGRLQAVMFNLGYLPGADKSVITRTETTLAAVDEACRLLAGHGLMTVLAYPGHAGGDDETRRLEAWLTRLDDAVFKWRTVLSHQPRDSAPRLFVIRKFV